MWYSLYTDFTAVRPSANRYAERAFPSRTLSLMVSLFVVLVVFVLEEKRFDDAVSGEGDSCDAESREGALEAVPP